MTSKKVTAALRMQEQSRRNSLAASRAHRDLAKAHPEEFRIQVKEHRAHIDKERGPLPGDKS